MGQDPEILGSEPVRLAPREQPEPAAPDALIGTPTLGPPSRRTITVVVVIALVAALAWYADARQRRHEASTLAACHARLTAVSREYDVQLGSMFDYAKPTMSGAAGEQAGLLRDLMARPARHVLPQARDVSADCSAIHPLPWHGTLATQREADVAYAAALVGRLARVSAARTPFHLEDGALSRLRAAADVPPAVGP